VRRNGVPMWSGNCVMIVCYALIGAQQSHFLKTALQEVGLTGSIPGGLPLTTHESPNANFSMGRRRSRG